MGPIRRIGCNGALAVALGAAVIPILGVTGAGALARPTAPGGAPPTATPAPTFTPVAAPASDRSVTTSCTGLGTITIAVPAGTVDPPLPPEVQLSLGFRATDARSRATVTGGPAPGEIQCSPVGFTALTVAEVTSGPAPAGVAPADLLSGTWLVSITLVAGAGPVRPNLAAPAVQTSAFAASLQAYLSTRVGSASVAVYNATDGTTYTVAPQNSYVTASIVKADILATLLRRAQDAGRGLTSQEQATATQMIEVSDNNAATALWNEVGGSSGVGAFNRLVPMPSTVPGSGGLWGLTRTTAADQVALVRNIAYPSPVLGDGQRAYEHGLMQSVTPSQRWGVSGGVPAGVTVALKNGWLPISGGWEINSIGHISGRGKDYVIAVLTSGNPSMPYGITTIQGVASLVWSGLPSIAPGFPKPTVARNSNGTLEVFASTGSGRVLTSWQTGASQPFGGWLDMGLPAVAAGAPVVAAGGNGALQVFVRTTDKRLLTSWQTAPSQPFGGWLDMGLDGQMASDPSVPLSSTLIMQVFIQGTGGRVLTSWQTGANQPFGGWLDLGMPASAAGVPTGAANGGGALQVFAHTADNRLLTSWQSTPGKPFGGWLDMGADGQIAGDPSVGLNPNGSLEVFVRHTAAGVLTASQAGVDQPFGAWLDLALPAQATGVPAVGTNRSGALQLVVHTSDNRLLLSWQPVPGQAFGGWVDMGLDGQMASDASAGASPNGAVQVFVRSPAGGTLTSWQSGPNQPFGGWLSLNMPT